jgi:hypothetical protein
VKTRPSWVVIAPKRKTYANLDEDWEVIRGKKDHDAIVEYAPGSECAGDEELAQAVSRSAKLPAYILWCNEDYPRVQVFAKGRYAGEINAWPDHVARQLGCTFPTMEGGRGKIDLTPHKTPDAQKGEQRIGQWTVRQWKHMIAHDSDWSILLDGAGEDLSKEVLAYLDDKKADVRVVACTMLCAIGYIGDVQWGLGKLANSTYERMRDLEANDPDAKVRAAARKTADSLASSLEMYAVRAEFPWIVNYSAKALDKAIAALDDERAVVRSYVVSWWSGAYDVPKPHAKKAEKKLAALLAKTKDKDARSSIKSALSNLES